MNRSYYKTIYSFAPTDFLQKMQNQKGKELALTMPGMSTNDQLAEIGGVIDACNQRRNESYTPQPIIIKTSCKVADAHTKELISDMKLEADLLLSGWIGDELRPELFAEKTCALLDACYAKISCIPDETKQAHKEKMQKNLLEIFAGFHEAYFSLIGSHQYYAESVRQASQSQNMTETQGLGFGLITNSVSHALLYDFMNTREHEKQYQRNIYNYRNTVDATMAGRALNMKNNVLSLYDQFITNLEDFFNTLFDELQALVRTSVVATKESTVNSTATTTGQRYSCVNSNCDDSFLTPRFLTILRAYEKLTTTLENVFHIKEKFGKHLHDYLNQDIVAFLVYLAIDESFTVTSEENQFIGRIAGDFYDGMSFADIVKNSDFRNYAWKYTLNTDAGSLVIAIADALDNEDWKYTLKRQMQECANELIVCNGYLNDRALNRMNAFFS